MLSPRSLLGKGLSSLFSCHTPGVPWWMAQKLLGFLKSFVRLQKCLNFSSQVQRLQGDGDKNVLAPARTEAISQFLAFPPLSQRQMEMNCPPPLLHSRGCQLGGTCCSSHILCSLSCPGSWIPPPPTGVAGQRSPAVELARGEGTGVFVSVLRWALPFLG